MNSVVLWEGASRLNGEPVTLVLSGVVTPSKNTKTGPMLQAYVLPKDAPVEAQRVGADESVCGDCVLRPFNEGGCYVKTFQAPTVLHKRLKVLPRVELRHLQLYTWQNVRFGAWGDPAAVPTRIWRSLARNRGWTGYTHQWRRFTSLRPFVMASVESKEDALEAQSRGWRTYRVDHWQGAEPMKGEIECPYPRVQCDRCLLCNGAGMGKNIVVSATGAQKRKF